MKIALYAVSIAALGSVSFADMTITSVYRYADVFLDASGDGLDTAVNTSDQLVDFFGGTAALFDDYIGHGTTGEISIEHESGYSVSGFNSDYRMDYSTMAPAGLGGVVVSGGQYRDEISFTLDERRWFQLDALTASSLPLGGSMTSTVGLYQLNSLVFYAEASGGQLFADEQIALNPGTYELRVMHSSIDTNIAGSARSGFIDSSVSFQIVPTPSALSLLTISGLLATRRRR